MLTFSSHTIEENTQSLADTLPNGPIFLAKNKDPSNLRKFLTGLAYEITRGEEYVQSIADEYDINETSLFIEQFESALGIPDDCLSIVGKTLEERRQQIIAKIRMNNVTTRQQFIDLAAIFGFEIQIFGGAHFWVFPLNFPAHFMETMTMFPLDFQIEFTTGAKRARFTMVVKYIHLVSPLIFPLPFAVHFSTTVHTVIECLFNRLKPANTEIIFAFNDF